MKRVALLLFSGRMAGGRWRSAQESFSGSALTLITSRSLAKRIRIWRELEDVLGYKAFPLTSCLKEK